MFLEYTILLLSHANKVHVEKKNRRWGVRSRVRRVTERPLRFRKKTLREGRPNRRVNGDDDGFTENEGTYGFMENIPCSLMDIIILGLG